MKSTFILISTCILLYSFINQEVAAEVSGFTNPTDTIVLDTLFVNETTTTDHFQGFKIKRGGDLIFRFIITNLLNYSLDISASSGDGGLIIDHYTKRILKPKELEEIVYIFHTKGREGGFSKTMTVAYKPQGESYKNQKVILRGVSGVIE